MKCNFPQIINVYNTENCKTERQQHFHEWTDYDSNRSVSIVVERMEEEIGRFEFNSDVDDFLERPISYTYIILYI